MLEELWNWGQNSLGWLIYTLICMGIGILIGWFAWG